MTRNKLTGLAIFSICLATAGAWLFTRAQQAHTETTSGTDSAPHTHTDSKGLDQAARSAHSETHYSATQVLPLHQLQSINSGTSSDIVFNLFNTLKLWISQSAENISLTKTVLLTPSDGSAASKRQRSILYGALSETSRTEAAAALVELAGRAQTEDDYIQAVSALADHQMPTAETLPAVWKLYESRTGIAKHVSLLAYGSIAHHRRDTAGINDNASDKLITLLSQATSAEAQMEVLSAMGNHGSSKYFSLIEQATNHNDEMVRAAAVYALRFHPTAAAGTLMTAVGVRDQSQRVKDEALKGLATQISIRRDYQHVTKVALSSPQIELQIAAAIILKDARKQANNEDVNQAIATLRAETQYMEVKALLDS